MANSAIFSALVCLRAAFYAGPIFHFSMYLFRRTSMPLARRVWRAGAATTKLDAFIHSSRQGNLRAPWLPLPTFVGQNWFWCEANRVRQGVKQALAFMSLGITLVPFSVSWQ